MGVSQTKRTAGLFAAFALLCLLILPGRARADAALTGRLLGGRLTLSVAGLGGGISQVVFYVRNADDSTDYRLDAENVSNGKADAEFTVAGSDYIAYATGKNAAGADQTSYGAVDVTESTVWAVYSADIQKNGWQNGIPDGAEAGTEGKALRLEALKVSLAGAPPTGAHIVYQAHVQNIGWQKAAQDGGAAGTVGKGLRVEALRLTLQGLDGYEVRYRAYVQRLGWLDWQTAQNGAGLSAAGIAGTTGRGLRMEAVEISVAKVS